VLEDKSILLKYVYKTNYVFPKNYFAHKKNNFLSNACSNYIYSPGLLVEWLTRLTYNPKRVGEQVRSRPEHIQKLVNKLLIQRGSVG
jgi:hypothetical protein